MLNACLVYIFVRFSISIPITILVLIFNYSFTLLIYLVWHVDETHLFAVPDDFNTIQHTFSNSTIPCKPTSPEIDVKLFIGDKDVSFCFSRNKTFFLSPFKNHVTNHVILLLVICYFTTL